MKSVGEGFNSGIQGLEQASIPGKQPGIVTLVSDYQPTITPYGEPIPPPIIDQPRVKLPRVD